MQPDIAIYCNVNTFGPVRRFARDIVQIVDLCGPVHFEELMIVPSQGEIGATLDGERLKALCLRLVERLRAIDYIVTVSERQKYFWLGYCSMAGFLFPELKALVCPFCVDAEPPKRKLSVKH